MKSMTLLLALGVLCFVCLFGVQRAYAETPYDRMTDRQYLSLEVLSVVQALCESGENILDRRDRYGPKDRGCAVLVMARAVFNGDLEFAVKLCDVFDEAEEAYEGVPEEERTFFEPNTGKRPIRDLARFCEVF